MLKFNVYDAPGIPGKKVIAMPSAIVAAEEKEYIERDEVTKQQKKIHKYVSIITVAGADDNAVIYVEDPDRTVLERIERYMASNQR